MTKKHRVTKSRFLIIIFDLIVQKRHFFEILRKYMILNRFHFHDDRFQIHNQSIYHRNQYERDEYDCHHVLHKF